MFGAVVVQMQQLQRYSTAVCENTPCTTLSIYSSRTWETLSLLRLGGGVRGSVGGYRAGVLGVQLPRSYQFNGLLVGGAFRIQAPCCIQTAAGAGCVLQGNTHLHRSTVLQKQRRQ